MFEFPGWLVTLLGLFAPWLIQFLKINVKQEILRFWISVVVVAATGAIACWVTGRYESREIISAIVWTFMASQVAFKTWWKPLFKKWLPVMRGE